MLEKIEGDKNRFYKVDPKDTLTVVAVTKVTLESSGKTDYSTSFISRTNKDHKHAELLVIEETKKWLEEQNLTGQATTVRLTTMATKSPCSNCQSEIKKMLEEMKKKYNIVKYTLRISDFYHEMINRKRESDEDVAGILRVWKLKIEDLGVDFTLEAISVCDELKDHTPRLKKCDEHKTTEIPPTQCSECKKLTEKTKSDRSKRDLEIKDLLRQSIINEYFRAKTRVPHR